MTRLAIVPEGLFDSRRHGFAQVSVVATPFGEIAHVSGQVAWDSERRIVGEGDIGRQLEKSLDNLAAALATVGAALDDVGALRLYIRESHLGEGQAIAQVLKARFGDTPPCATWIGVSSLARAEFLIEVEASPVILAARR